MVEWWLKLRLAVWGVALVLGILGTAIGIVFSPITDLLRIFGLLGPAGTAAGKGAGLLGAAFKALGGFLGKAWSWLGKLWPLLARLGPILNIARFGAIAAGGAISGPFAIALAIAAAAVAGFYLVWRNWDRIKPAIDGMVSWVSDRFGRAEGGRAGRVRQLVDPGHRRLDQGRLDSLVGFLGELPGRIGAAASGPLGAAPELPGPAGDGVRRVRLAPGVPGRAARAGRRLVLLGAAARLDIAALLPDVGRDDGADRRPSSAGSPTASRASGRRSPTSSASSPACRTCWTEWADQFEAGRQRPAGGPAAGPLRRADHRRHRQRDPDRRPEDLERDHRLLRDQQPVDPDGDGRPRHPPGTPERPGVDGAGGGRLVHRAARQAGRRVQGGGRRCRELGPGDHRRHQGRPRTARSARSPRPRPGSASR